MSTTEEKILIKIIVEYKEAIEHLRRFKNEHDTIINSFRDIKSEMDSITKSHNEVNSAFKVFSLSMPIVPEFNPKTLKAIQAQISEFNFKPLDFNLPVKPDFENVNSSPVLPEDLMPFENFDETIKVINNFVSSASHEAQLIAENMNKADLSSFDIAGNFLNILKSFSGFAGFDAGPLNVIGKGIDFVSSLFGLSSPMINRPVQPNISQPVYVVVNTKLEKIDTYKLYKSGKEMAALR